MITVGKLIPLGVEGLGRFVEAHPLDGDPVLGPFELGLERP